MWCFVYSRSVIILALAYLVKLHLCGNSDFPPIQDMKYWLGVIVHSQWYARVLFNFLFRSTARKTSQGELNRERSLLGHAKAREAKQRHFDLASSRPSFHCLCKRLVFGSSLGLSSDCSDINLPPTLKLLSKRVFQIDHSILIRLHPELQCVGV